MGVSLEERNATEAYALSIEDEYLQPRELMSADSLIDRHSVELHALELIANASQNPNYTKNYDFYHADARTALFEALRASGHLSVIKSERTSLEEIHKIMLGVLTAGWSDRLPVFEQRRRFQEICEELTIQEFERRVSSGDLPRDMQLATISDYVNSASEKQALALGYRPYNKKGMVRSVKLVVHGDGTFTRVTEQASRSNADAYETERFLAESGVTTRQEHTADVRVLGTQLMYSEQDMQEGVVGLLRRLDAYKGVNIRYGENAHEDQVAYEDIRVESARREREAECYVSRLADYTNIIDQQLSKGKISADQHRDLLQQEVLQILRAICTMRPDYARDCFGEESYKTYKVAASIAASGDVSGAAGHIENNSHLEKTVTLCGMSISAKEATEKGINADSLDTLIKLGLEKFKTRTGRCRVPECPSPKPTEVGPCDVCMISCQPRFDKGMTYSKIVRNYKIANRASKKATESTFRLFSFKKTGKREKMAA